MRDRDIQMARLWLHKADNDIITARQTLLLPDGPTDTPSFHAQQAAEKALKALLALNGISFPKTHDLTKLLDAALALTPHLEAFRERFADMSAYAVEALYPGEWEEPGRDAAVAAFDIAEELVRIVKKVAAGL